MKLSALLGLLRKTIRVTILLTIAIFVLCPSTTFAQSFFAVPPCQVLNTTGGTPMSAGAPLTLALAKLNCNIPGSATAVSLNLEVTNPTTDGFLTLQPPGIPYTGTTNINFRAHQSIANNAIQMVSSDGNASFVTIFGNAGGPATTDLVIHVNGYFSADTAPASVAAVGPLLYQAVSSCRI